MAVETFIGWRYLKAKRRQTFISLITVISLGAVALGVAAMIVVLSVMSGFENDLKSKILGVNSHIVLLGDNKAVTGHRDLLPQVEGVKGVASAEPFIYSQVIVSALGFVSGAVLRGVDPDVTIKSGHLPRTLKEGSLDLLREPSGGPEGPAPPMFMGIELAKRMGLLVGDRVKVISPIGRVTPLGNRAPVVGEFLLAGVFETGMYEYDSTIAYISLAEAQKFLGLGDSVTGIEVWVNDIYRSDKIKETILGRLGPGFKARDWMEMNRNLFSALKLEKVVMFIILTLTILVGAFNIISTLTMGVMEKTRDIAILKSMGATNRVVMRIFVFQGLIVGGLGTLLGLIGGLTLCELLSKYKFVRLPEAVYYITELPVVIDPLEVALITLAAIVISFLATLYPAWQAAGLSPVEALRYE